LIGLVAFVAWQGAHPPSDCHHRSAEQVNIVFDKTKTYGATQANSIDRLLKEVLEGAADGAEINIFYFTHSAEQPHNTFSTCKPHTHGNPLLVDAEQEGKLFRAVVREVKRKIDVRYQWPSSAPLVESLATISRERIVTANLERGGRANFYLFSDMIQDSPEGSLAGCKLHSPRSGRLSDLQLIRESERFQATRARIERFYEQIQVAVFAIHREAGGANPSEECLRTFWQNTFHRLSWLTI
jgi:hypothetical protein